MAEVTIDVIARDLPHGGWALILVEEGPWPDAAFSQQLRRVQERLYDCLDAALDGAVTQQYPEALGRQLLIRLDAYNLPEAPLRNFYETFSAEVVKLPDYESAIAARRYFSGIAFELNVQTLADV